MEAKPAESGADALREHLGLLGRVAMALLGDATRVEQALERVAREVGSHEKEKPDGVEWRVWLLGFVRAAAATQLSQLPLKRQDTAPTTERLGGAAPARSLLSTLKPTEREAVVLSIVGGLEAKDIAHACNVDIGTAKTRLAKGLEELMRNGSEK